MVARLRSIIRHVLRWLYDRTGLAGKNLWEFAKLLVVPAVLAGSVIWFNSAQAMIGHEIENNRQHESALQAYLDDMTLLLLDNELRTSALNAEVRNIARMRTLTVLRGLDAERKGLLLELLQDSNLINKSRIVNGMDREETRVADNSIISLRRADLSKSVLTEAILNEINLSEANLSEANLSGANLFRADLSFANLSLADLSEANLFGVDLRSAHLNDANLQGADLSGANLSLADLSDANLFRADLSNANLRGAQVTDEQLAQAKSLKGATMPDGSKYDGRFNLPGD